MTRSNTLPRMSATSASADPPENRSGMPFPQDVDTQECLPGGSKRWYVQGAPGTRWEVRLTREENSGGHAHSGGPTGTASPSSGVIPAAGTMPFVYKAPLASGRIRLNTFFSDGTVDTDFMIVRVPGLQELLSSESIRLIGKTSIHPSNHFGHPALLAGVRKLASAFYEQFNRQLQVNDISLEWGGIFDLSADWTGPHHEHRDGRAVDIRTLGVPIAQREFIARKAVELGFEVLHETSPVHDHLRMRAGSTMIRSWEKEMRNLERMAAQLR